MAHLTDRLALARAAAVEHYPVGVPVVELNRLRHWVVPRKNRFDWVFPDLALLGRLVKLGGVIFVDDYQLPAVAKAVAFFAANRGWTVEEESLPPVNDPDHGWVVMRTPSRAHESHYTDFVDF